MTRIIYIGPHECEIIWEHGEEWACCAVCGAQWALPKGGEPEQVAEGDGYCEERG